MKLSTRVSTATIATIGALVWATPAFAHVTVSPGKAEKGGFAELVFSVPDEQDSAATTKVEVFFPSSHPIPFVAVRPIAGWKVSVDKKTLAKPIQGDDGKVTEAVSSITWTGNLQPGEYEDFAVSVDPLPSDTSQLVFKALQTYSNGDVVRWIDLPNGGTEPAHPAPILTLTDPASPASAGTAISAGAASATPSMVHEGAAVPESSGSDGLARGLGLGGLALGLAAVAMVLARSRQRTS